MSKISKTIKISISHEEWLKAKKINFSEWVRQKLDAEINQQLRSGNRNKFKAVILAAGKDTTLFPLTNDIPKESLNVIFDAIKEALSDKDRKLLIHREILDEQVPGILAGYLIYSKLLDDPILARTILEKILEKPLSPKAIALIPTT